MKQKWKKHLIEGDFLQTAFKTLGKKITKAWKAFLGLFTSLRKICDLGLMIASRYFLSLFTPIQNNKIVFMTYNKRYMCNPKYIAEEIIRQKLPWDLVWVVPKGTGKNSKDYPAGLRLVEEKTFAAFQEIFSARVWIDNAINFTWIPIPKKKNQIYFNTWHGAMGIKRIGKDDQSNKVWVKRAKKCGRRTNFCISNSTFENNVFRETYWPRTPILTLGHARNDVLFDNKIMQTMRRTIYRQYGIPPEGRVIMYAPTFRDSGRIDCYDLDYEKIVNAMEKRFGGVWYVFLRLHFHDRKKKLKKDVLPRYVIDVTAYPDMQELMMVADAGITDYSSWAYDYVLTRKPLFIHAIDLDEYNTERGLYYKLETTPFPISADNDELEQNMLNFDDDAYQSKIDDFLTRMGSVEDGHAAERIVAELGKYLTASDKRE